MKVRNLAASIPQARGTHRASFCSGTIMLRGSGTLEPLAPLGLQQPPQHPGLRSPYFRTKQPIGRTCVIGKRKGCPLSSGSPTSEGAEGAGGSEPLSCRVIAGEGGKARLGAAQWPCCEKQNTFSKVWIPVYDLKWMPLK